MLPEEANSTSLPKLPKVLRTNSAFQRIVTFTHRFGDQHIALAMHTALPIGLNREIVHQIRSKFVDSAPEIAVEDLLHSHLCRYIGGNLYEMYPDVRDLLLDEIKSEQEFGPLRVVQVSEFLLKYAEQALEKTKYSEMRDFLKAQRWSSLAYARPKDAAQSLAFALRDGLKSANLDETIWITRLIQALSTPLIAEERLVLYASVIEKLAAGDKTGALSQFNFIGQADESLQIEKVSLPALNELKQILLRRIPEPIYQLQQNTLKKLEPRKKLLERNRLVLSHRHALVERKMNRLEVGEVVIGTVRGIKPYGAFIDIGGASGLLHISEISHEHIDTPHSVFNINDEVKVMIIDLDAERGRISLSTKQLEPEPGDMIKNRDLVYDKAEEMAAKYREQMLAKEQDFVAAPGDTATTEEEIAPTIDQKISATKKWG